MLLDTLLPEIENSSLGHAVRALGGWGYAWINLAHLLSIATLFGAILILDLRLLGWRAHIRLTDVSALTLPFALAGFAGAVLSGICMLSANASEYQGNPVLLLKFAALLLALANAGVVRRIPAWQARANPESGSVGHSNLLVACGVVSLVSWLTVIAAGRMIAYW